MNAQERLAPRIAECLRRARQQAGLSQTEAAQSIGVRPNTICGWETGARMPRAMELALLCEAYGCTADYLIGRAEYAAALPVGELLIDQEVVDRILRAKTVADLEPLVDWEPQMISFWQIVRQGTRVASHRQVQALMVELAGHVQKIAPGLWSEFESGRRDFKKRQERWSKKTHPDGRHTS